MDSFTEEEYIFFDAHEDIASISDAKSDTKDIFDSGPSFENSLTNSPLYELWINSPRSVRERRCKFLNWMRMGLDQNMSISSVQACSLEGYADRIRESSGAVLRKSGFEDEVSSTRSIISWWSNDNPNLPEELGSEGNFESRDGNSGQGMACGADEVEQEGKISEGSELLVTADGSENVSVSSPLLQQHVQNKMEEPNDLVGTRKRVIKGWLRRLRSIACVVDTQLEVEKLGHDNDDAPRRCRVQRVKVHLSGKRTKELSALYKGQDIQAHEGPIFTMKFSVDGQYLGSAGEDGIVRLWQILEDERSNELDIPEIDPSCIYFTVNHVSELKPLFADKEKMAKLRTLRKTSDSACVIFPPRVFRILEKPLHEFHGHSGKILDLSWSKNNHLLSASVDKTVRLWRVGCDSCLRVFSHTNYVTCVQFNPVDDNYFMSGSIDGKVRIWAIPSCQVVDWTDIKDMVTAVCYRPNGQGGIVGSMAGNCRFYDMSDSHLQLDAQISIHGKKKSPGKRITCIQVSPQDANTVMVTCADSQVRVLQGLNVIGKYKGVNNSADQICASFTSDGKHIISASEDSNVYLWSCVGHEEPATLQVKKMRSCERFSANASVAIPWCGLKHGNSENGWGFQVLDINSPEGLPFSPPTGFSLSQEYFLESFPKGSATWPEENLPTSSPLSAPTAIHKSQYKFLKASCQSTASCHAWGLVIVTAGWDGRIRSFPNYGLPVAE